MEGADRFGLLEQAMYRSRLAAGLRSHKARGVISDDLRFRAAEENSRASAALLKAWATCKSTMEWDTRAAVSDEAARAHQPADRSGETGSR